MGALWELGLLCTGNVIRIPHWAYTHPPAPDVPLTRAFSASPSSAGTHSWQCFI